VRRDFSPLERTCTPRDVPCDLICDASTYRHLNEARSSLPGLFVVWHTVPTLWIFHSVWQMLVELCPIIVSTCHLRRFPVDSAGIEWPHPPIRDRTCPSPVPPIIQAGARHLFTLLEVAPPRKTMLWPSRCLLCYSVEATAHPTLPALRFLQPPAVLRRRSPRQDQPTARTRSSGRGNPTL
jgi:hypothetical protein